MKAIALVLVIGAILIGTVAISEARNLRFGDWNIDINEDAYDFVDNEANQRGVTPEEIILERGVNLIEDEHLSTLRNEIYELTDDVMRTGNLTKIVLAKEGLEELLSVRFEMEE